jgi:hypothetical protein
VRDGKVVSNRFNDGDTWAKTQADLKRVLAG